MNRSTTKTTTIQKTNGYDPWLVLAVMALVGIGLVMVYSASSAVALKEFGSDAHYVKRQFMYMLLGFLMLIAARRIPFRFYFALAYPILFAAILMVLLVHVPGLGVTAGGATRWLRLGPIRFQPAEVARLALIIYLAYSMTRKRDSMGEFSVGVVPHILVTGFICFLLMLQPDFGSSVLMCAVAGIMLFVGGARLSHLGLLGLCAVPLGGMFIIGAEYRLKRVLSFWNPWACETDAGYQIAHSLMAFGTGGIAGVGPGKGYQKLFYLPEPHTDFVFSVVGEELGLWGVCLVLLLFALVVWRGLVISKRVPDRFGSYLAAGITASVGLQAFVNMAVAMGLLPTKGLTLPFLSYGGTSLVLNLTAMGILMNIASYRGPREVRAANRRRTVRNRMARA